MGLYSLAVILCRKPISMKPCLEVSLKCQSMKTSVGTGRRERGRCLPKLRSDTGTGNGRHDTIHPQHLTAHPQIGVLVLVACTRTKLGLLWLASTWNLELRGPFVCWPLLTLGWALIPGGRCNCLPALGFNAFSLNW